MPEKFESSKEAKVEEATDSDLSETKRIDRVAEKAAEKASKAVQEYDKDHTVISH
jgi:hypothetical protein